MNWWQSMQARYHPLLIAVCIAAIAGCTREKDRLDDEVRQLCAKDGGVRVYETVNLANEKFDKSGLVRIPLRKDAKLEDEYYLDWEILYFRRGNPEMSRERFTIIRRSDKKVLGEAVYYGRGGGDLPGPWHESSFRCPDATKERSLEASIFLPERLK